MWWNERFSSWMCRRQICSNCVTLSWQYGPKSLRNVSNTLLNLCHEELRQFWRQKGIQPGTGKVYLIKWPVSLYLHILECNSWYRVIYYMSVSFCLLWIAVVAVMKFVLHFSWVERQFVQCILKSLLYLNSSRNVWTPDGSQCYYVKCVACRLSYMQWDLVLVLFSRVSKIPKTQNMFFTNALLEMCQNASHNVTLHSQHCCWL